MGGRGPAGEGTAAGWEDTGEKIPGEEMPGERKDPFMYTSVDAASPFYTGEREGEPIEDVMAAAFLRTPDRWRSLTPGKPWTPVQ